MQLQPRARQGHIATVRRSLDPTALGPVIHVGPGDTSPSRPAGPFRRPPLTQGRAPKRRPREVEMNRVLLTGRLTRDPELRTLASGKTVTHVMW